LLVAEEEAFEVAGEQEDRLDGTDDSLYSRSKRRSSSLGGGEAIVISKPKHNNWYGSFSSCFVTV